MSSMTRSSLSREKSDQLDHFLKNIFSHRSPAEQKQLFSQLLQTIENDPQTSCEQKRQIRHHVLERATQFGYGEQQQEGRQTTQQTKEEWKLHLIWQLRDSSLSHLVIELLADPAISVDSREYFLLDYFEKSAKQAQAKEQLGLLLQCAKQAAQREEVWQDVVGQLMIHQLKLQVQSRMEPLGITRFSQKVLYFEDQGIWGSYLLDYYSLRDLQQLEKQLRESRDRLLSYDHLNFLLENCLSCATKQKIGELPQEMWMGMAMCLAISCKDNRVERAAKLYEQLSTLRLDPQSACFSQIRSCLRGYKEAPEHLIERLTAHFKHKK